jgi:hypothetical protein
MSSIDAAIIKTLTEHMEQSSLPQSELVKSGNYVTEITNSPQLQIYNIPHPFDILKLKRKDSERIDTFICLEAEVNEYDEIEFKFYWLNNDESTNITYFPITKSKLSSGECCLPLNVSDRYSVTDRNNANEGVFTANCLSPELMHFALKLHAIKTGNFTDDFINILQ